VVVVDKPDAGQAAGCIVCPTIRRAYKDYAVGRVANGVLGEGYSSRLNQEVRIKRGLSYGAGSGLGARRDGGFFFAYAQTPPTGKAFKFKMCTVAHWKGGVMDEEYLFWDNLDFMKQIRLAQ